MLGVQLMPPLAQHHQAQMDLYESSVQKLSAQLLFTSARHMNVSYWLQIRCPQHGQKDG